MWNTFFSQDEFFCASQQDFCWSHTLITFTLFIFFEVLLVARCEQQHMKDLTGFALTELLYFFTHTPVFPTKSVFVALAGG